MSATDGYPSVSREQAICYVGVHDRFRQNVQRKTDIHVPWAFQLAVTVADFLFNTHRYVFAINFYQEILVLVGLLASKGELSLYFLGDEFPAQARSMTEELEMTKRALQSDYTQEEDEDQTRPTQNEAHGATNLRNREIVFYTTLGSIFYSLGRYMTSIWYYEKASEMIKANGDKLEEQRIYTCLAVVHNTVSQDDKAIALQKTALQLSQEIGDLKGELECYNNLGSLYTARGQFDFAINYYSIGLEVNDRKAEAAAHNNIGNVYHASSQYDKAIHHHKESLRIRKEIDDTIGQSISHNNLCCDYFLLGQYERAIKKQEKALKMSEAIGAKKQVAVSYGNLGVVYQAQEEYQPSLENHEKGLKVRKEIGDIEGECRAYKEISGVHDNLHHLRDSAKYHNKALILERAITKKRENVVTPAHHGRWIAHKEQGLEIIEEIGVGDNQHLLLYKMALSHTTKLDVLKASDHLAENIKSREGIRQTLDEECKLAWDEQSVLLYKKNALMLISFEHYTDALLALEQGRARALVDLIWRKYAIQEVVCLNFENLSGLPYFFETRRENFVFIATLMDSICFWFIDRFGKLRFKPFFVTKEVLHDSLLNYFYSPHAENNSEHTEWQVSSSDQEAENLATLNNFLQFLTYPPPKEDRRSVPFLHQVIFGFVDELLDHEEIIFVPEGPMFQVPFAALQNANHNYLVEKVRTRVIPSITTLKILLDSPADYHSKVGALLVGDPESESLGLPRLPFATVEVEMIAKLLGLQESCLIGQAATKSEVLRRIPNVSLVHFSAHGSLETGEIALAGDESCLKEDCILTIGDVAKVGIKAKLVVLSSCHSGRGKIMAAEGVVGIARAFLGCGARSVLVALWAIEDQATLNFMEKFYTHLLLHKMSASRALQKAMNEMRETSQYNKEEYWAPFVLYGDDVTLDLNEIRARVLPQPPKEFI